MTAPKITPTYTSVANKVWIQDIKVNMAITYTIDHEKRLVSVLASEKVDLQEVLNYICGLLETPETLEDYIEHIDLSRTVDMRINYEVAQQIVLNHQLLRRKKKLADTVFYAPTDLGYGMANMMAQTASAMSGDDPPNVHVTREPLSPDSLREYIQST